MMKQSFVVAVWLALSAFASASGPPFFEMRDIIGVAEAEIARRGSPRPAHTIVVPRPPDSKDGLQRLVYFVVRFQRNPTEDSTVFEVIVNRDTKTVESFRDLRKTRE